MLPNGKLIAAFLSERSKEQEAAARYSDDNGYTWSEPHTLLTLPTNDGRWMLIRTQLGRFYESFSGDGANWSAPQPSSIISSDSLAGLVRLDDGRILLFWNNSLRFPYADGGRRVPHAVISEDEDKTWRGYREVAHDPLNHQSPATFRRSRHGLSFPAPGT